MEEIAREFKGAKASVWTMDEHRIGLKPILRRVWTPPGTQPVAKVWQRFDYLYLSGFVRPATGANRWWLHDKVNIPTYDAVLDLFAQSVGAGPNHEVILVVDGAGWHTSAQVVVPPHVHLVRLPPYSPELAPAERLWELSDQPLFNRYFETIDELEAALRPRMEYLQVHPEVVRGRVKYHWWTAF